MLHAAGDVLGGAPQCRSHQEHTHIADACQWLASSGGAAPAQNPCGHGAHAMCMVMRPACIPGSSMQL